MGYSAVTFLECFETDKDTGPAFCFFNDTNRIRLNALGKTKRSTPRGLRPSGITECSPSDHVLGSHVALGLWNALEILWLNLSPRNLTPSAIASSFNIDDRAAVQATTGNNLSRIRHKRPSIPLYMYRMTGCYFCQPHRSST